MKRFRPGSLAAWLAGLLLARSLVCLAYIVFVPSSSQTQVESGTVVIIGYSKEEVIIAADSRETDGHGAYRDEACKIAVLNNKLMFTAAGEARSVLNGSELWDATREARAALADTERLNTDAAGDFIDRVARRWGALLATNIGSNMRPEEALKLANDQVLVNGMFIGLDDRQGLHMSHEIIRARIIEKIPEIAVDSVKVVTMTENILFRALGEGDISDEFEFGRSTRSRQWKLEVPRFARVHRVSNEAAEAMLRVDLTGAYGRDTVPNNPTVHLVGGKTDAAELKRGGRVHWISRKSQCPER